MAVNGTGDELKCPYESTNERSAAVEQLAFFANGTVKREIKKNTRYLEADRAVVRRELLTTPV